MHTIPTGREQSLSLTAFKNYYYNTIQLNTSMICLQRKKKRGKKEKKPVNNYTCHIKGQRRLRMDIIVLLIFWQKKKTKTLHVQYCAVWIYRLIIFHSTNTSWYAPIIFNHLELFFQSNNPSNLTLNTVLKGIFNALIQSVDRKCFS